MSKRLNMVTMLLGLSAICANVHAETTNAPLTFYFVSKERIDGGQFFNRFPLPKLGYISSKPDLVVERLKEVSSLPETSWDARGTDLRDGTRKKVTMIASERFFFTLRDEDASRLRPLAKNADRQNPGVLLLVLFGDKAIGLVRTEDVLAIPWKAQFEIMGNWGRDRVRYIADDLKALVR